MTRQARQACAASRRRASRSGEAGSGQLTETASASCSIMPARATPFTPHLISRRSDNRFARGTGTSFAVRSAAADRTEYLRRPDLGRRLSPEGVLPSKAAARRRCRDRRRRWPLRSAIEINLLPLLDHLRRLLLAQGLTIGPLVLVEQGRVAIGDEIGEMLGARLVVVLIGERPGLSAADSLGAYITWRPRIGTMDSNRNCISNIRSPGLPPKRSADRRPDRAGIQACRDRRPAKRFAGRQKQSLWSGLENRQTKSVRLAN